MTRNMFHVPYSINSDADSQMQELNKLEQLTIDEYTTSPNLYRKMSDEVEAQYNLSDTCLEEVVVEKLLSPTNSEKQLENVDCEDSFSIWNSIDTLTQEEISEFICPPELCKKTELTNSDKKDYDSDDTCDEYVECGEKGLCKCQKMRGREYYEYYARNKEREPYTMYPQGRCELPKGAILHFTGASKIMKREDLKQALVAIGANTQFIDYQKGNEEGWVRLSFPYEARIIIKKMIDKKLNVAGAVLQFRVLSGKDEKRYHKKAIEAIYQLHEKSKGLEKKLKKAGYSYVSKYKPEKHK